MEPNALIAEIVPVPACGLFTGAAVYGTGWMGSGEWRTAIRNATIGSTHRQSGSIFIASGVKGTETLLGSVVLNFQIVRDCLTTVPVANDHLIERLLQMEELHAAW